MGEYPTYLPMGGIPYLWGEYSYLFLKNVSRNIGTFLALKGDYLYGVY